MIRKHQSHEKAYFDHYVPVDQSKFAKKIWFENICPFFLTIFFQIF